jgi:uncharacterized GH25 family protein
VKVKQALTAFIRNLLSTTVVLAAGPAQAHEFWITPSTYQASTGDTVALAAYVGTGFRGERKPYAAPRALTLSVVADRERDLRVAAVHGALDFGRFLMPDPGGALVAYRSDFAFIELNGAEFDRYLVAEGLDAARARRRRSGRMDSPARERYARCPKTWIAGRDSQRALKVMGLPLEVVPLRDPAVGPQLPLRVLYRGRPLPGALVRAWRQPLAAEARPTDAAARDSVGVAAEARTDRRGVVTLSLPGSGEWLVSTVHMVASADPREADWESFWASLTFARGDRSR